MEYLKTFNGDFILKPHPIYISQFSSRNLVSKILDEELKASDDERWREFGFDLKDDYDFWSWRLCGLICVLMVIKGNKAVDKSIKDLTLEAVSLGGYVVYNSNGEFVDKGWYYKPLIKWARRYGLLGKVRADLSVDDVMEIILGGSYFVASVNPKLIRFDIDSLGAHESKGGHLVLVHGLHFDNGICDGFYIHNPSGRTVDTQEDVLISVSRFGEAFAGRGFTFKIKR